MDREMIVKELEESIAFFRDRLTGDLFDRWLRASVDALALLKAQTRTIEQFEREREQQMWNMPQMGGFHDD